VLLAYQQAWVADPSPLKVIEKSRRTGLTWAEAADNVLTAASAKSAGGQNVYYIAYNQDMTIEYVQACAMWAHAFNHAADLVEEGFWDDDEADRHIKTFTIRFPASGHRIVALTSRPSNLRGRQGTIVIDEAAFHDQLDELLKAALAMLIWGGRVRVISTHNGADNPFAELIESIRAKKRKGVAHRVTFREAIADGLYRRVCLRLDKPWSAEEENAWAKDVYAFYGEGAAEELDCIPAMGGGAYLPLALIETRMAGGGEVPLIRHRWPPEFSLQPERLRALEVAEWRRDALTETLNALDLSRPHGFGMDFARVGDLTVITVLEESSGLALFPRLVVEISNCPFRQQEQILEFIVSRLPRLRGGALDANGNGAQLAEYMADRFGHDRILQIHLSEKFYMEEMPRFKAHLEDATLDGLPRDEECRDDLRAIKVVGGIPKIPRAKTQTADGRRVQRHGDFAISLFLADHAMRREIGGVCEGFQSASRALPFGGGADVEDDGDIAAPRSLRMF
jgi:phage FluMu gp28-like protein